jgi:hypothetical protein
LTKKKLVPMKWLSLVDAEGRRKWKIVLEDGDLASWLRENALAARIAPDDQTKEGRSSVVKPFSNAGISGAQFRDATFTGGMG